jgi:putative ubiquitin-RnfH superfamily antitoxin RatB of RatAB toxin-antitoxin module
MAMLAVTVAIATGPRQVLEATLQLAEGAVLADAVQACRALPGLSTVDLPSMPAGVWGRKATAQQVLKDGDRVELYRPLQVDPKRARRERFASQGARGAGLFAKRHPGAKAGY